MPTVRSTLVVPHLRLAHRLTPAPRSIPIASKQERTGSPWASNALAIRFGRAATHTSCCCLSDAAMAPIPPNLYGQVVEWVTRQQQLALAGEPATMTAPQRKALIELHQLIKPAEVEPDIGNGAEWIGLLNHYRQANPSANPSAVGIEYTNEPVGEPPAPIRWIVYCRIAESPEAFPGPAGGLDAATGLPPSFARKQSAKHYAAKCAYEWLLDKGYIPRAASLRPPPGTGEVKAHKRVTALCTELGLPPPRYNIAEAGGAYEGFAAFEGITKHRFATGGLGHVKQALTRNVAQEMIAEAVEKELLKMKENRDKQKAAIMGPAQ